MIQFLKENESLVGAWASAVFSAILLLCCIGLAAKERSVENITGIFFALTALSLSVMAIIRERKK